MATAEEIQSPMSPNAKKMSSIGLDDLDPKALGMIQKAYHNSFLVLEQFEDMRTDFKLMEKDVLKVADRKMDQQRQEIRDTLHQQISFIEEQSLVNKQAIQNNLIKINKFEVAIENLTKQNDDAFQTLAQQTFEHLQTLDKKKEPSTRYQKTDPKKKEKAHQTLDISYPNVKKADIDILELDQMKQFTSGQIKFSRGGRRLSRNSIFKTDQPPSKMKKAHSVTEKKKDSKLWLVEGFKLQNVLNNQLFRASN
mmetsp:Transcript_31988/g.48963  ORF Transcript_31988/g.48963 Transcript_31988/m.48963 type:complete len:252 (-) Transcript_31988:1363-2118(-)